MKKLIHKPNTCIKCNSKNLDFYFDSGIDFLREDYTRCYKCNDCEYEGVKSYIVSYDGDLGEDGRFIE